MMAIGTLSSQEFLFQHNDQIGEVKDEVGSLLGRSRVWPLLYQDVTQPEGGGIIDFVPDRTEGEVMFRKMTADYYKNLLLSRNLRISTKPTDSYWSGFYNFNCKHQS